jgi:hypothetical protein
MPRRRNRLQDFSEGEPAEHEHEKEQDFTPNSKGFREQGAGSGHR